MQRRSWGWAIFDNINTAASRAARSPNQAASSLATDLEPQYHAPATASRTALRGPVIWWEPQRETGTES